MLEGAIAPLRSESFASGTTNSMSMPIRSPNPSHVGQAPSGLLKLNNLGSGAGYSMPQFSQASCVLKPSRCQERPSIRKRGEESGERGEGELSFSTNVKQRPFPLVNAVSKESRRWLLLVPPAVNRSTTI